MTDRREPEPSAAVTALLQRWVDGDEAALDRVTAILYKELKGIAAAYLRRERGGHTLQPTALLHEAYLRLNVTLPTGFANRRQFLALTAKVMRQVLVDHARQVRATKRGGGANTVVLTEAMARALPQCESVTLLDDALTRLARLSERQARVIELRYFGGFEIAEVGEILGISTPTVSRDQRMAIAWLTQTMAEGTPT